MEQTIAFGGTGTGRFTDPTLRAYRPRATRAFKGGFKDARGLSGHGASRPSPNVDPIQDLALDRTT